MLTLAAHISAAFVFALDSDEVALVPLVLCLSGFVFYTWVYLRYRNTDKRHHHEKETATAIENIQRYDQFVEHRKRLSKSSMKDSNDTFVEGLLSDGSVPAVMKDVGKLVGIKFDK
jgi:hypothetical protein